MSPIIGFGNPNADACFVIIIELQLKTGFKLQIGLKEAFFSSSIFSRVSIKADSRPIEPATVNSHGIKFEILGICLLFMP